MSEVRLDATLNHLEVALTAQNATNDYNATLEHTVAMMWTKNRKVLDERVTAQQWAQEAEVRAQAASADVGRCQADLSKLYRVLEHNQEELLRKSEQQEELLTENIGLREALDIAEDRMEEREKLLKENSALREALDTAEVRMKDLLLKCEEWEKLLKENTELHTAQETAESSSRDLLRAEEKLRSTNAVERAGQAIERLQEKQPEQQQQAELSKLCRFVEQHQEELLRKSEQQDNLLKENTALRKALATAEVLRMENEKFQSEVKRAYSGSRRFA